jgi:hypothetical protein
MTEPKRLGLSVLAGMLAIGLIVVVVLATYGAWTGWPAFVVLAALVLAMSLVGTTLGRGRTSSIRVSEDAARQADHQEFLTNPLRRVGDILFGSGPERRRR